MGVPAGIAVEALDTLPRRRRAAPAGAQSGREGNGGNEAAELRTDGHGEPPSVLRVACWVLRAACCPGRVACCVWFEWLPLGPLRVPLHAPRSTLHAR